MKKPYLGIVISVVLLFFASLSFSAYHHEGEKDAEKFLEIYPEKKGTKLDHCALCHTGGEYEKNGKMVSLGSCQWCHYTYGYDGSGNILDTMNQYGKNYHDNGRNTDAIIAIESLDSDGDGFDNKTEITANRFPGDAADDPNQQSAPYRIYTKGQLEAMASHTQFILMNTSRSGDFYAEYTGVPMEDLLNDAGILDSATNINVYAPDGWSQYHPLEYDETSEMYHVFGTYPSATYQYDPEAEEWCDYSAPSCTGRNHNDPIAVTDGLKMILAYKREGAYLDTGVLSEENKLDGEGPYRVVVPQKTPSPPDQSSTSDNQNVVWAYNEDWDHNAGSATRSVTIIKVEPLPEGTTDINVMEAGWNYVDQGKIIIYGAIDGSDSNGNGILDSEEKGTDDFDNDGISDYQDKDTACFRHAQGDQKIQLHTSKGSFANVAAIAHDDSAISQLNKPSDLTFKYGTTEYEITDLDPGDSVTVTLVFPENIPTTSKYYKIDATNGWQEIPFGSNDGDNQITIMLTDGDATTDADGTQNGIISDPGALGVGEETTSDSNNDDDDSGCFISASAF